MDMTWRHRAPGVPIGDKPPALHGGGEAPIDIAFTSDITALEREWLVFQERAAGTFFQTYHWCRAWFDTIGADLAAQPLLVTGRFDGGELAFLLPLCLRKHGNLRIVEWIATGQSGYGYGLYDPNFLPWAKSWFAGRGWHILRRLSPIDAVYLRDMPEQFYGYPHPLTAWFSFAGANSTYTMRLDRDFETLYSAKRSPASRRGNRKRDAKLFAQADTAFGLPVSASETHALLDEMFAHQQHRLFESGIAGVFDAQEKAFVHRLAQLEKQAQPLLLPYHLKIGGKLAAMMLGGNYAGTYWALISSLAPGDIRKYSPGDAALRRTIQACCEKSFTTFDFSSGDMLYKRQWADRSIRLHDTVRAVTCKGYIWALTQTAVLLGKRIIKRSPPLWAAATAIRKSLARSSR